MIVLQELEGKKYHDFQQPTVTVQQSFQRYAATFGSGVCLVFPQTFKKLFYDNDFKFNTIFLVVVFKRPPLAHCAKHLG